MTTLSGTSVVTSSNSPPAGATFGIVNVRDCVCRGRSVSEAGETLTEPPSTRNVPTGEPEAPPSETRYDLFGATGGTKNPSELGD